MLLDLSALIKLHPGKANWSSLWQELSTYVSDQQIKSDLSMGLQGCNSGILTELWALLQFKFQKQTEKLFE